MSETPPENQWDPNEVPEYEHQTSLRVDETPLPRRLLRLLYKFLLISAAAHLIGLIIFGGLIVIRNLTEEDVQFKPPPPMTRVEPRKIQYKMTLKKTQKRSRRPKVQPRMMSTRVANIALPEIKAKPQPIKIAKISPLKGMGTDDLGSGFGEGSGLGVPAHLLSSPLKNRCSRDARIKRLRQGGGLPETDKAVVQALRYLKSVQNENGSWDERYPYAMTGLALLAFLGHCEDYNSPEFGETVKKAVDWLLAEAENNDGYLGQQGENSLAYAHGICTYALAEARAITLDKRISPVVKECVRIIIEGQGPSGGWVYQYTRTAGGDTSVSGWQIQALKAAYLAGVKVRGLREAMEKALEQLERVQSNDGHFGYRNATPKADRRNSRLTGVGVLAHQIWRKGSRDAIKKGLKFILENQTDFNYRGGQANLYAWYYETQACFNAGDEAWETWNAGFQKVLLDAQNGDGSWPRAGGPHGGPGIMTTCLCTLMLEVYYRYLPSYEKR
jgi:hypothetical protein